MSGRAASAAAAPLCPSAPAAPGAALIGLVQPDGTVANLPTPLPVNQGFIDRARQHGRLEQRFRFAAPCQTSGCTHWDGGSCGLIGDILHHAARDSVVAEERLPSCGIRAVCRWWDQEGPHACAVCTLVATDARDAAPEVSGREMHQIGMQAR